MTEEPYRWLEAIANRREYVREQLRGGAPAFAVSRPEGILLLSVGSGQSKVFELFDRHAVAGLGHPADLERIRQFAIDAAHTEAFTRAPEDVSLRRLISFGLGPQLKTGFEQIFAAPYLVELVFVELGSTPQHDLLARVHFDGGFRFQHGGVLVAASQPEPEAAACAWLSEALKGASDNVAVMEILLQAWWCLAEAKPFGDAVPDEASRRAGWRQTLGDRIIEAALLDRHASGMAKYKPLEFPRTLV